MFFDELLDIEEIAGGGEVDAWLVLFGEDAVLSFFDILEVLFSESAVNQFICVHIANYVFADGC